jgi:hypothetical protein
MPIPLSHEDYAADSDMDGLEHIIEKCVKCQAPTRFWHHASNNPVCTICAQVFTVADLPVIPGIQKEKAPKALSKAQIDLLQENDVLELEIRKVARKLHLLQCEKRTLHRKMTEAKVIIKNPIE